MTIRPTEPIPRCIGCDRTPPEIDEYVIASEESGMTPTGYVRMEEGTYNTENGHFACTACYIQMGMPTDPYGWKAP